MTNYEALEILVKSKKGEEVDEAKGIIYRLIQVSEIVDEYIELWADAVEKKEKEPKPLPVTLFTDIDGTWKAKKVYHTAKELAYDCFKHGKNGEEILILEGDHSNEEVKK